MNRFSALVPKLTLIFLFCVVVALGAPMIGFIDISFADWFNGTLSEMQEKVLYDIRLPRVALGFLAGGILAVSGLVYQGLLRNSLATPFTLGVASGASLGSAIYIHLGIAWSVLGLSGASWLAFAGALLATFIVFAVARAVGRHDGVTLLLAGIAVTFFFSSVLLFAQYIADFTAVFKMIRWVMGGLSVVGYEEVISLAPFAVLLFVLVIWRAPELNIIATGDELAVSRGVNVKVVSRVFFGVITIAVGATVALVGPIGFIGMMAPHMMRLLFGADNRILAPVTFVVGGAFLALCDTIARVALAPAETPVGIITALIGGPFFLWLLIKTRAGATQISR